MKLAFFVLSLAVALLSSSYTLKDTYPEDTRKTIKLFSILSVSTLYVLGNKKRDNLNGKTLEATPPSNSLNQDPLMEIIEKSDENPHIMICSKTGGGKSTLAQYLSTFCKGKRYVVSPHYDRTKVEWEGCHGIYGIGRNYGSKEDPIIEYDDILTGKEPNPTANQVIVALFKEMDRRYSSGEAFESFEKHDWILDEVPAIARALGKTFSEYLSPLLFEARKVGIRLWVLTQSDQVKTLNIEGEGAIRKQFTYIYLSDAAYDRCRSLGIKPPKDLSDYQWCVVNNSLSLRPTLEETTERISNYKVENRVICKSLADISNVKRAFRSEVNEYCRTVKSNLLKSSPVKTGLHLDHVVPLHHLIYTFLSRKDIDIKDIQVKPSTNPIYKGDMEFIDRDLAQEWYDFHKEFSELRLISEEENLSKGRKEDMALWRFNKKLEERDIF